MFCISLYYSRNLLNGEDKNEKEDLYIRVVTIDDAKEILDIYAPYVEKTAITFEYDVSSLEEFKERMKNTSNSERNIWYYVLGDKLEGGIR